MGSRPERRHCPRRPSGLRPRIRLRGSRESGTGTPETVYQIGSISKQFTAAAILQLVDLGKLRLTDTLGQFVPEITHAQRVTVAQLLNHTSGIRSYTDLWFTPEYGPGLRVSYSPEAILALFRTRPLDFTPGSRSSYNNSGYYLLGLIVEKVSGVSYPEYLATRIFEPLGLKDTRYCRARDRVPRRARGYLNAGYRRVENADVISETHAFSAGALCSTVLDLLRWQSALANGRVTDYGRMIAPTRLNDGTEVPYGFGLAVGGVGGHRSAEHSGGYSGFWSHLAHYPDDSLTIVVLTNVEGAQPASIEDAIARRLLGVPEPRPRDLPTAAADRERFAGTYVFGGARMGGVASDDSYKVEVRAQDDSLVASFQGVSTRRLLHQGNGVFVHAGDRGLVFVFQSDDDRDRQLQVRRGGAVVFEGSRRY